MRVMFIDASRAYTAQSSLVAPLGGTQTAVGHLANALARAGVGVIVANLRADDSIDAGVEWVSLARIQRDFARYLGSRGVTHLVVVSRAALVELRPKIASDVAWVLWNHHWIDQPALTPLVNPTIRDSWDAIVSISEFQYAAMMREFQIAPDRHWILRNAVNPVFASLFSGWDAFRFARENREGARFIYSSTPFRGLNVLVAAWARLAPGPGLSCTAVSGMGLYGQDDRAFEALFATLASIPGMKRLEPMGQASLAAFLAEHDFWAYPCTFIETSCISALEAVAAGLYPITTMLGALPETLEGWGRFVAADGNTLVERWCEAAREEVLRRDANRVAWLHANWMQREHVLHDWNWDRRAREWIGYLERIHPHPRHECG